MYLYDILTIKSDRCPDRRKIAVKVVDIFDNDILTIAEVAWDGRNKTVHFLNPSNSIGLECNLWRGYSMK